MTPEERVSHATDAADADPNGAAAPLAVLLMHLAAAIREAENEAIDRALAELTPENVRLGRTWLARRIRSLKHPVTR